MGLRYLRELLKNKENYVKDPEKGEQYAYVISNAKSVLWRKLQVYFNLQIKDSLWSYTYIDIYIVL